MSATSGPRRDDATYRAIAEAIGDVEISETEAWHDLDVLSSHTQVDDIEVFVSEIKLREDGFEGPLNVHCTLHYGRGADGFTVSETYPGRFEGTMGPGGPIISRLTVDTSAFYT